MLPGHPLNSEAGDRYLSRPAMRALLYIGRWLLERSYRFVTVTPSTHARLLRRSNRTADTLQDIFGWNLPFVPDRLPPDLLREMNRAEAMEQAGPGLQRARIRFSTLGDVLFLHSGYPTIDEDAVFFGPDTYRFCALIEHTLRQSKGTEIRRIADIGCGTGAGGIVAAKRLAEQSPPQVLLTDINPLALTYAAINLELAQTRHAVLRCGDLYAPLDEAPDLIVANPPYLLDAQARLYRHGGGELGSGLSLRIVREGLLRLAPGGILILYTGSPIVSGRDIFLEALNPILKGNHGLRWSYAELDPDVFGEEIDSPGYRRVDRIAAVSLVIHAADPDREPA